MDAGIIVKKKNMLNLAGLMFSCSIFLNIACSTIFSLFILILKIKMDYSFTILLNTTVHAISVLVPACIYFFYVRPNRVQLKLIGTRPLNIFLSVLIGLCAIPLVNMANYVVLVLIKSVFGKISMPVLPGSKTITELILGILFISIYPAISEELYFRGIIQGALESRFKRFTALVVTALLFGLNHFSIQIFTGIFLLGLLFSFITNKTGSLLPAIIIHFINNAVSTIQTFLITKDNVPITQDVPSLSKLFDLTINNPKNLLISLSLYIVIITLCTGLLIVFYKCLRPSKQVNIDVQPQKHPGISAFIPGIFLTLLILFVEIMALLNIFNGF